MTRNRFTQIGIDRLIRLAWLERVSLLVLAGIDAVNIKNILQIDLRSSFRSANTSARGSMDKTITVLLKVWLNVDREIEPLRIEGLNLLKRLHPCDHLAIHWGMLMAAYPFWSAVAAQTGRLLRLQGSVAAPHVQRRVREQYGERETVSRATQRVMRSYLDWGVLQETSAKGVYSAGAVLNIDNSKLIAWLIESSLCSRTNDFAPLKDLIDSPSLFPFRIKPIHTRNLTATTSRLDLIRHGLDDNLVMLRKHATKDGTP